MFTRDYENVAEQYDDLRSKLMRVYVGPSSDTGSMSHIGMFHEATRVLRLVEKGWNIEQLDSSTIRENLKEWTSSKFLVDWLLESSVHVILCQGIHNSFLNLWGSTDCMNQTKRLEYHPGFPLGNKLRCPVFNGDKWGYLLACAQYCLPSFKLLLNVSDRTKQKNIEEATKFMESTNLGFGFILKAGYVQNKVGFSMRYLKSAEELPTMLTNLHTNASRASNKVNQCPSDVFDYLILQPRVQNREVEDAMAPVKHKTDKKRKKLVKVYLSKPPNESKIILLNGEAQYICSTSKLGVAGMHDVKEIFAFCENAVKELSRNTYHAFLMDGLSRVDVFSVRGKLRVNEFENIDAQFSKLGGTKEDKELELKVKLYLVGYYTNTLNMLVNTL